jgi:type VI secretion system protein ImpC
MSQLQAGASGQSPEFQDARAQLEALLAKTSATKGSESETVDAIVGRLLEGIKLEGTPSNKLKSIIADIDSRLSAQINEVMHNERFQQAEGAWRGLYDMVTKSPTHESAKIKVLNVAKEELNDVFAEYPGADFQNSPLFKKIYNPLDTPGAQPFATLIGDYYFGSSPTDMRILKGMGAIAQCAHAPFVSAAAPSLLKLRSWTEVNEPERLQTAYDSKGYEEWNSFRKTEEAKYVALTCPRRLSRRPYGAQKEAVPGGVFVFEEDVMGGDSSKYVWSNVAYDFGTRAITSFVDCGLAVMIQGTEAGGAVWDLPTDMFTTDNGGADAKCPTEIAITGRTEKDLSENCGLLPLSHYEGEDFAVFFGSRNLHKAQKFSDSYATANSKLGTSLPNIYSTSRFAHYLKKIVTDWSGKYMNAEELREKLQKWINQYVLANPEHATEEAKASKPLAEADVIVTPVDDNPGYYNAVFKLRPHYKLQGVDIALQLVSSVKQRQGG